MTKRRIQLLALLLPAGIVLSGGCQSEKKIVKEPTAVPITIAMEDCKGSRPGKITSGAGVLGMIFSGPPKDELVKRGAMQADGQTYTLYLPKAKSYSIENTGSNDSDLENTSTIISVDHVGNGKLTDQDGWCANLPIRLGDKMYDVSEIAVDGSRIILKPSKSPLRGVIVGRACPPFSFKTADGVEFSNTQLGDKAFILDIWSIT